MYRCHAIFSTIIPLLTPPVEALLSTQSLVEVINNLSPFFNVQINYFFYCNARTVINASSNNRSDRIS